MERGNVPSLRKLAASIDFSDFPPTVPALSIRRPYFPAFSGGVSSYVPSETSSPVISYPSRSTSLANWLWEPSLLNKQCFARNSLRMYTSPPASRSAAEGRPAGPKRAKKGNVSQIPGRFSRSRFRPGAGQAPAAVVIWGAHTLRVGPPADPIGGAHWRDTSCKELKKTPPVPRRNPVDF